MNNSKRLSPALAAGLAERERRARQRQRELRRSLEELEELARAGDPLPYIDYQWPGIRLDEFQKDALRSLCDPTLWGVFLKGNTGCGKGACGGLGIVVYYAIHHDAKVVITSATHKHAVNVLFGEVKGWWKRMRVQPAGTLLTDRITDTESHYIEVVNPDSEEAFSGRHSRHALFAFDEATSITETRFKMARTQATKFLALSNPRTMHGWFRTAFPKKNPDVDQTQHTQLGRCRFITIDGEQVMNVRMKRLDKPMAPIGGIEIDGQRYEHGDVIPPEVYDRVRPLIPGQVCYDKFLTLKATPDRRWVNVFCHGRFPQEDLELQVFPGSWVDPAMDRWTVWETLWERSKTHASARRLLDRICPVTAFGLDVAASVSGDESVIAAGGRFGCRKLHMARFADTMDVCGWLIRTAMLEYGINLLAGVVPVAVDQDGVGKGPGDRLLEMGVNMVSMRGGETAQDPRRYLNARAERHGWLAERLNPAGRHAGVPYMLPNDHLLGEELAAVEKIYQGSDGFRFGVSPKHPVPGMSDDLIEKTLQHRLGRSPDRMDAVVYMNAAVEGGGIDLGKWLDAI